MNERLIFNPKQLTSARIARGLTMKELAEKAELSRQMISNYESGKTIPKADSILKLISVFPVVSFQQIHLNCIQAQLFLEAEVRQRRK